MGYQQEVVERVIKETGQTEDTFLILEKIVAETKNCEEGTKRREKETQFSPRDSPSATTTAVCLFRDRELNRSLVDPGRSKENIKPSQHSSSSNGLGHRRQCSSSESSTQQVSSIFHEV